jgi:hypothetical protein
MTRQPARTAVRKVTLALRDIEALSFWETQNESNLGLPSSFPAMWLGHKPLSAVDSKPPELLSNRDPRFFVTVHGDITRRRAIRDGATRAGVSYQTVSRLINVGPPRHDR